MDLGRRLRAVARRPGAARRDGRAGGRARAALQVRRAAGGGDRRAAFAGGCAGSRARADAGRLRARRAADLHRDAGAQGSRGAARLCAALLGGSRVKIVVGHLFPDYLNIYADRGNMAVLARRAAWRGHELEVRALGIEDEVRPGEHDLYYVGGGQDREQELIAPALAAKGEALREAAARGAAVLAVCGGYQLLGRFYRDQSGDELPGVGLFPLHTVAGERRMIGDVLLECELEPGEKRTLAGFENHAGRTILDESAQAVAHRTGDDPPRFEALPDELEAQAHAVSAGRARSRGGRF